MLFASAANVPALQLVAAVARSRHALPGGHGEHCDWADRSVALLKLPFSHGSAADAPVGHTDPGSHGRQTVELGRGWYVPPPHGVHSGAPNASLMVPGEHGV